MVNRTDTNQERHNEIRVGTSPAVELHAYGTSRAFRIHKLVQSQPVSNSLFAPE